MKIWPPGKHHHRLRLGREKRRPVRPRPTSDLANWLLHDEKLLVETRFGGDRDLYGAWRDRLWTEIHDAIHHSDKARGYSADEEYVVMIAFDGDWAQYRICRDRLREELWQIMKVTNGH
jgi:hypothetical protein